MDEELQARIVRLLRPRGYARLVVLMCDVPAIEVVRVAEYMQNCGWLRSTGGWCEDRKWCLTPLGRRVWPERRRAKGDPRMLMRMLDEQGEFAGWPVSDAELDAVREVWCA